MTLPASVHADYVLFRTEQMAGGLGLDPRRGCPRSLTLGDRGLPQLSCERKASVCSMQWQSRLKMDLFSGDGVLEFQELGVQEISSIAGEAGEIFKRLAG